MATTTTSATAASLPKDGEKFDVIIVGGGPSGSSTAMYLGKAGKKVLLVDRAKFPRDKTCGDGISGKSVRVLKELDLIKEVDKVEHMKMFGVTFSNPKGTIVKVDSKGKDPKMPPGFVCRREVFDNVLFQNAKKAATTIEQFFVNDITMEGNRPIGIVGTHMPSGQKLSYRATVIVGADGAGGIVSRKLGSANNWENHQCSAIRAYYKGVKEMNDTIELHFVDSLIPGYFWIFPLPDGRANVGAGMLVSDMKRLGINLEKIMLDIIANHPMFKERFAEAEKISDIKRWQLPLGSKRVKCYGNGWVLIGDAASLIDPFSGEGIGNALMSGKVASANLLKAFEKNDFSEGSLASYEKELSEEIDKELQTSYKLQKLGSHKFLLNMVIDKASRSQPIKDMISSTLLNAEKQAEFTSPFFLLKVLFS